MSVISGFDEKKVKKEIKMSDENSTRIGSCLSLITQKLNDLNVTLATAKMKKPGKC